MLVQRDDPKTRRQRDFEEQCRRATLEVISRHSGRCPSAWPYEEIRTSNGDFAKRLRSTFFYWGALIALIAGITLLSNGLAVGGFLVLTLAPCLLLYPLLRFLFGGKEGVVPAIATVIVEEILKHQIFKAVDGPSRRKRR